nr:ATP-binding protein [Bacillus fungorum]
MNNSYQQLTKNLEYLKLKQLVQHLGEVVDLSINNQLSFVETIVKLTNYEIDVREQNMIHSIVKFGAFPYLKEIEDFDFQPSVNLQ